MTETADPSDNRNECPSAGRVDLERLLERLLASVTTSGADANRICRLCDPGVCGHPARCPVTQAATHGR
jgi:hypothetical protein